MDPILLLLFDELFTEFAIVEFEVVMVEAVVGLGGGGGGAPKSSKSLLSLNSKSNMSGLRSVMSWMRSYEEM